MQRDPYILLYYMRHYLVPGVNYSTAAVSARALLGVGALDGDGYGRGKTLSASTHANYGCCLLVQKPAPTPAASAGRQENKKHY